MRTLLLLSLGAVVALGAPSGPAPAAEVAAEPYGFIVRHDLTVAAPPERVWAAIGRIGAWWSSDHAISHDARNLSLSLQPGGCFCETFPAGGGARRMVVAVAEPGRFLTLEGALGPAEAEGAPTGRLMFTLVPTAAGTALTVKFEGGGWATNGLATWSPPVDRVLGEQAARLKRYVETGRPD